MCVIFSVFGKDPPDAQLRIGGEMNQDGAGVAWKEGQVIKWRKGIKDPAEVIRMVNAGIPKPYLIHFRKRSTGETRPELTHPFPIDSDSSLELEGESDKGVLAHNGTWVNWRREFLEVMPKQK